MTLQQEQAVKAADKYAIGLWPRESIEYSKSWEDYRSGFIAGSSESQSTESPLSSVSGPIEREGWVSVEDFMEWKYGNGFVCQNDDGEWFTKVKPYEGRLFTTRDLINEYKKHFNENNYYNPR